MAELTIEYASTEAHLEVVEVMPGSYRAFSGIKLFGAVADTPFDALCSLLSDREARKGLSAQLKFT